MVKPKDIQKENVKEKYILGRLKTQISTIYKDMQYYKGLEKQLCNLYKKFKY